MLTENAKNAPIPKKMALVSLPVFTYFGGIFGSKLMMMYMLSPYSGNVKNISPIFVIESHLSTQLQVYSKALQVYSKAVFNRSLEKFEKYFDGRYMKFNIFVDIMQIRRRKKCLLFFDRTKRLENNFFSI